MDWDPSKQVMADHMEKCKDGGCRCPPMASWAPGAGGGAGGIAVFGYPDNNPKTGEGLKKAQLDKVPTALMHEASKAMALGAQKYGPYNWRSKKVSSSIYYAAALRHLMAWWEGEDLDQESGGSHLGHVGACVAILLDGMGTEMLNDDRPPRIKR